MYLDFLPNELIVQVMHSCSSIRDVLSLAATCKQFQYVLAARRVSILARAVDAQYGPLQDAVQVVTYNASQSAHRVRNVPYSMALLKQIVEVGTVAQKWVDVFPRRKWKEDYAYRRLLTNDEAFRMRRAVYRLWLYSKAFHNERYKRTTRLQLHNMQERAELLHNWNSDELAEVEDVRQVIREELASQVCPSNGSIQRRFRKRHPESNQQLIFNCNIHLNYPPPASHYHTVETQHSRPMSYAAALQQSNKPSAAQVRSWANYKFTSDAWHNAGDEGWGDDIPHYYVVEDMLKLDPGEIMFLRENAPLKGMVESYVAHTHGDWFENNGETFGSTLQWVLAERGEELEEMRDDIADKQRGVVVE